MTPAEIFERYVKQFQPCAEIIHTIEKSGALYVDVLGHTFTKEIKLITKRVKPINSTEFVAFYFREPQKFLQDNVITEKELNELLEMLEWSAILDLFVWQEEKQRVRWLGSKADV